MHPKHIVVIGTSAGGLEALRSLIGNLPEDFEAAVCVVMHIAPQSPGVLQDILNRSARLSVAHGRDREKLRSGRVYVAPPDCHLLVEPGRVRVTKGPKENRFRPAVDPLFRSAAQVYGPAAIGVILTGNLDDGTAGLWTIKQLGGTAIVQDPDDAVFPSMPASALRHVKVDYCVPLVEIAPLLVGLTTVPAAAVAHEQQAHQPVPEPVEVEVKIAKEHHPLEAGLERIAQPSSFACPECHGVLLQLVEGGRIRFRCHTGHAYSVESLLAAISDGIEESLWEGIRALEEGTMLLRQMADHVRAHDGGREADVKELFDRADMLRRKSNTLRQLVTEQEPLSATKV